MREVGLSVIPCAVAYVAVVLLCSGRPSAQTVIGKAITDEQGFPGAVRVEDTWEGDDWAHATVVIPYLGVRGEAREGRARFYCRPEPLTSDERVPVYCGAHYEVPEETARGYCDRGFAVVTPHHGTGDFPFVLGDSYGFCKAMIQWARRLPCVDRTRLYIGGASGGGYMTLAMGAEFFPVSALVSDLPAVNWAYACNYLRANEGPVNAEPSLPVLALIVPGLGPAVDLYGPDLSAPTWHTLSPISYLDRITAPALVTCATGDMLCTIEQFTARRFFTLDRGQFPEGYERDFDALTLCQQARRRFDECIPAEKLSTRVLTAPEGLHEYTREDLKNLDTPLRSAAESPEIVLPWSEDRQWSLVILDEGAPLPHTGHTRYAWRVTARGFLAYHRERPPRVDQLNAAKLHRLMERYAEQLTDVPTLADGTPANQLNFGALERLDVVTGLLDYARLGPEHAARLKDLYRACSVRPFGPRLRPKELRKLETSLRQRPSGAVAKDRR